MNLETKITIYKFTPQLFTLTLNLLSGIYFCGVHIQSGRLQSDSHQPVAEKKLSILYQEEKQADYQLHFDCSYSFLHELRYSDHL